MLDHTQMVRNLTHDLLSIFYTHSYLEMLDHRDGEKWSIVLWPGEQQDKRVHCQQIGHPTSQVLTHTTSIEVSEEDLLYEDKLVRQDADWSEEILSNCNEV